MCRPRRKQEGKSKCFSTGRSVLRGEETLLFAVTRFGQRSAKRDSPRIAEQAAASPTTRVINEGRQQNRMAVMSSIVSESAEAKEDDEKVFPGTAL